MANEKSDVTKGLKESRIPLNFSGDDHTVAFDIDGVPEKLFVGQTATLTLFATCASGCELVGDAVEVSELVSEEVVASTTFTGQEGTLAYSDAISIKMPDAPGLYQYVVHYEPRELPMPEDGGPRFENPHESADLLLEFTVEAHKVNLSTWNVTAPAWCGAPINITVGANCTSGCSLLGQRVEIVDEKGELKCSGVLQEPLPPRDTLYWVELTSTVPEEAKLHRWEARFIGEDMDTPHSGVGHKFSFVARVKPERNFRITVIDNSADKPQRSARVELKPKGEGKAQYASTNTEGIANVGVSKGAYELKITAPSRKTITTEVDLTEHDIEASIRMLQSSSTDEQPELQILSTDDIDVTATKEPSATPDLPSSDKVLTEVAETAAEKAAE